MSTPLHMLYEEHDIILRAVNQAKNLSGKWNEDGDFFEQEIRRLVLFFKEYADGFHHRKEEEVLFPAVKDHPDFTLQEIVDEFMQHHEDFRDYAAEVIDAMDSKEYEKGFKILMRYCSELEDHIGAENDELFVLAENLMSPDELERLNFMFMDVDREIGDDKKREMEGSV